VSSTFAADNGTWYHLSNKSFVYFLTTQEKTIQDMKALNLVSLTLGIEPRLFESLKKILVVSTVENTV